MTALHGSCLCGAVRYEVEGGIHHMVHCHCRSCRKSAGAAFATNFSVPRSRFALLGGAARIREYESSPGRFRCFCDTCGGKLYARSNDAPDIVRIRMGSLDGDPPKRPLANCWVSHKVPWLELADDLPVFHEGPIVPTGDTRA